MEKAYWSAWNMLLHFPAQWEGAADHRRLGEGCKSAERDVLMELGVVRCLGQSRAASSLYVTLVTAEPGCPVAGEAASQFYAAST